MNASRDCAVKVVIALVIIGVASALGIYWTIGLLHRVRAGPPSEFSTYIQTESAMSLVGFAVARQRGTSFGPRTFPTLMAALAQEQLFSGALTNGVFPQASNPLPGVLPEGYYSRTLQLPAGFEPATVPLIWRHLHYADSDKVLVLMWSGGDPKLIDAKDFKVLLNGLVSRGFSTNFIFGSVEGSVPNGA